MTAFEAGFRVPFDGSFRVAEVATTPPKGAPNKKQCAKELKEIGLRLAELQRVLYAEDRWALLIILQGMDASGKDGTIRAVLGGVDPAGCMVHSFKEPSVEELKHDFLWRTSLRLPASGTIGVFNRSYYEEVLIARVHPELLDAQRMARPEDPDLIWQQRYESIREHEAHLARNGTRILKFWLNISPQEQRRRFLSRLEEPRKYWKFSETDIAERQHWEHYMRAYEFALDATSRSWAPWYAVPADDKHYAHLVVARIIAEHLEDLGLEYPGLNGEVRARLGRLRELLG